MAAAFLLLLETTLTVLIQSLFIISLSLFLSLFNIHNLTELNEQHVYMCVMMILWDERVGKKM